MNRKSLRVRVSDVIYLDIIVVVIRVIEYNLMNFHEY